MKYFRTNIAGLSVEIDSPDRQKGEVAPKVIRFKQYVERVNGDQCRVGYLATDNDVAIKKLSSDYNVSEISKDEFEKATDPKTAKVAAR